MRLPQRQPGRLAILTDGFFRQQSGRHRTSKKCRHRIHLGSVQYGAILGSDVVTGARRVLGVVGRLASTIIYDDIDDGSLHATRRRLNTIVDAEAALMGEHRKVLLGGASQGCCAAFDAFARHPARLGGFVGFVGHPLKTTPLQSSLQRDVPCFFFNAAADDTMRTQWVLPAIRRLAAAGWTRVNVEVADGADHGTSDELENHWMDSFLAQFFASL